MDIIPTKHLVRRAPERLVDLSPELDVGRTFALRGVLVVDKSLSRPCKLYIDVDGIGRFVIVQAGERFVGITFVPRIFCHDIPAARAEG